MSIKEELEKLKEPDLWSLMLFVLYKVKEIPEYCGLSELAYVLDKKNLLRFCEYFGGCTLTVPKIQDLELLVYGLLMYQYIDIEHISFEDALELISRNNVDLVSIKNNYHKIKDTLDTYEISSRSKT